VLKRKPSKGHFSSSKIKGEGECTEEDMKELLLLPILKYFSITRYALP
jgi:hypothetical protein